MKTKASEMSISSCRRKLTYDFSSSEKQLSSQTSRHTRTHSSRITEQKSSNYPLYSRRQLSQAPHKLIPDMPIPGEFCQDSSEMEVLCTNCFDHIGIDEVDKHSQICLLPLVSEEEPHQIPFQIRKLLNSVRRKKQATIGDKVLQLIQIEDLALATLEATMAPNEIKDSLNSIVNSFDDECQGLACSLIAQRLLQLVQAYETHKEKQNIEFEKWKQRTGFLMQIVGFPDIHKDLSYNKEIDISQLLSTNEQTYPGDLEKYFFSLCLQRKAQIAQHSPLQNLLISDVYERVIIEKVPVAEWPAYINSTFYENENFYD